MVNLESKSRSLTIKEKSCPTSNCQLYCLTFLYLFRQFKTVSKDWQFVLAACPHVDGEQGGHVPDDEEANDDVED